MTWDDIRVSKFLALVLRHKPEEIGLHLDAHGWAQVDELLQAVSRKGCPLDFSRLNSIVENNDKKRFQFNDDRSKIRAAQGHSTDIDLNLKPVQPPGLLYHGTATRFVDSIKQLGLQKQKRHHVHLSARIETAIEVGKRYGKPLVLNVNSRQMSADGYQFFLSDNSVWLTDHVPVQYIEFPES